MRTMRPPVESAYQRAQQEHWKRYSWLTLCHLIPETFAGTQLFSQSNPEPLTSIGSPRPCGQYPPSVSRTGCIGTPFGQRCPRGQPSVGEGILGTLCRVVHAHTVQVVCSSATSFLGYLSDTLHGLLEAVIARLLDLGHATWLCLSDSSRNRRINRLERPD